MRPVEQGVSFGRHRFDLETGRLWSGKREVRLTPKASAVLKALVTHAGQPVRKDELFASVWKGTVVRDDALTSCIQELRKALRTMRSGHASSKRDIAAVTNSSLGSPRQPISISSRLLRNAAGSRRARPMWGTPAACSRTKDCRARRSTVPGHEPNPRR